MNEKNMTYLQFKATADKLVLTHHDITAQDLFNVLSEISTPDQVGEYFERWQIEKEMGIQTQHNEHSKTLELEKALSVTRATLESTADAILIIDKNGKLVDFNQKFLEVTEVPHEIIESGEENAGLGYLLTQLKDPQELVSQMQYLMMHPEKEGDMGDVHFKNGKIVERYSQPHRIGQEIVGRVWSFRDVTERRKQEESLRLTNRAISASTHGIILIENNEDHTVTYLNPASINLLNLDEEKILQRSFFDITHEFFTHKEKLLHIFKNEQKESVTIECQIKNRILWLEISIDPVYEKDQKTISHFVSIINDITKSKELENILQYKAVHDSLTGLPNKTYIEDAIRYRIRKASSSSESFGLLFVDIDRFKNINDTLGHRVGDKLLCLFSSRMQNNLQKQDVMARIGGDEFIFLINNVSDMDSLNGIANRLLEACRRKFSYTDHEFNITASVGIVHYPECGADPETLIRNADIAMYQAKQNGRNRSCFYSKTLNHTVSRRVEIENELHNAISNSEFELHYQPIYDIAKKRFEKAEALIRWKNKRLGQISPVEFIPMAEEIGMMTSIGRWATETAVKQLKEFTKNGIDDLVVSLNVSAKQLTDEYFVTHLNSFISSNEILSKKIILEITESFFLQEEKVSDQLDKLNSLGIKIAIDDFGTGYSNLNYLNKLHISYLKIDKSFIDQIDQHHFNDSVILAIIAIAKRMKFKIIAEGVETETQLDFLAKHECDEIQGYYFSKPLPAAEFEKFIKSKQQP